ncbi:MAG: EAL domain-containing protein [Pseudomonadota bacterium]
MKHALNKPVLWGSFVFLVVLAITATVALVTTRQITAVKEAEFQSRADSIATQIERRTQDTIAMIRASATAIQLSGDATPQEMRERFYTYFQKADVLDVFPYINSTGLILNGARLATDQPNPPVFPILGVYPKMDSPIIGRDLNFSPERREALHFARDAASAAVTDRIILLGGDGSGILIAHPIYSGGAAPMGVNDRRDAFLGTLVTTFSIQGFTANALDQIDLEMVDFELHDLGSNASPWRSLGLASVLASTRLASVDIENWLAEDLLIADGDGQVQRDIEIGGHTWRLFLAPKVPFTAQSGLNQAGVVLAVGFILAALAGFATFQQIAHATRLKINVEERTRELKATADDLLKSTQKLKSVNTTVAKQANEDALTGLGNRRALADALERIISTARQKPGSSIAVVHIDLDRFKQINDTMGHAGGDSVLCHVADLMRDTFPADAFCARVGGDEFSAVMALAHNAKPDLIAAAETLVQACAQPFEFEGRPCRFGASVGIATEDPANADGACLLVNADLALYRAKGRGRGCVQEYTDEIQAEVIAHKTRADDILRALEADEFVPFFQPQIEVSDGSIHGVEALARWQHPTLGLLPPAEFLSVAQDLGVVAQIDRVILDKTIAMANRAHALGFTIPRVSTNLSFSRLLEPDFHDSLEGLPACKSRIAFEILESIFLDDDQVPALWNIDLLKETGMEVEIDDFGSGRASVVALTKVAPKRMKIDRELVGPIVEHPERLRLVQSIVEIGKALDIKVTAEGVETEAQARLLADLGCDVLQGYLFSRPIPEASLYDYLGELNGSEPMFRAAG